MATRKTDVTQPPRRSRLTLWLLVALFFGPLTASYAWYFLFQDWRPPASVQHGELLQPARPLPDVRWNGAGGDAGTAEVLAGRWSLVYFAPGACDEICRSTLHDLRQLRLTLGRNAERVQRVWFYTGEAPDARWLAEEHPNLLTVPVDGAHFAPLLAAFSERPERLESSDQVFIVDPLGNLVLRYPPEATLRGIRDDLDRLLRASRIG